MMTTFLNQTSDINILFIGMGIGLTCGLTAYLIKSVWFDNTHMDKEVQTEALEKYSDNACQTLNDASLTTSDYQTARISPTESWPWNPTLDRVSNASSIEQEINRERLIRYQEQINSENKILDALRETRETSLSVLERIEELKSMRAGTQQIQTGTDNSASSILPIPNFEVLPIPNVNQLIANRPLGAEELLQIENLEKISAWVELANNLFN